MYRRVLSPTPAKTSASTAPTPASAAKSALTARAASEVVGLHGTAIPALLFRVKIFRGPAAGRVILARALVVRLVIDAAPVAAAIGLLPA
jgi:hypothetical protein